MFPGGRMAVEALGFSKSKFEDFASSAEVGRCGRRLALRYRSRAVPSIAAIDFAWFVGFAVEKNQLAEHGFYFIGPPKRFALR